MAVLAVHHTEVDGQVLTGGAEKYVRAVVGVLLRSGAAVHVAYSGTSIYDGLEDPFAEGGALTVERTNWINADLRGDQSISPRLVLERRRRLREMGADTVFAVQQDAGGSFLASLIAARSLGLRVVSSIRQMPPAGATGRGPTLRWSRLRRRLAAACCDEIIFPSRCAAEAFQAYGGLEPAKARVIRNPEPIRPSARRDGERDELNVVAAGRITEVKGADLLLEAFGSLSGAIPRARLRYFGDGPLASRLRERAEKLGLGERVTFSGFVGDADQLYDAADVYVQASRREALSNSVIEAMARGVACVVTDVGGSAEAIIDGRCGRVVPPGDRDALAAAISELLLDQALRRRYGANARRRAAHLFDPTRFEALTSRCILG